jgi:tellurite resistance protein
MSKLLSWLKTTSVRVLDPNREQRISESADEVWRDLKEQSKAFDFKRVMSRLGADVEDNPLVADRVYEKALQKAWADSVITDRERQSLDVIGRLLSIPPHRSQEIEQRYGLLVFESALGQAFADGQLESAEAQTLTNIASGLNSTPRQLILRYFSEQGDGFLRGLFAKAMQQDAFTPRDWQRLVLTAAALGLNEADLRQAVCPQAQIYIEHVLADAKADGQITASERQAIRWLLETLGLDAAFTAYVWAEVEKFERYARIAEGRLPSLSVSGVALRAGEIVHHQCTAAYIITKQLSSGPRAYRHDGYLTITDNRVIFSSPTKSFDVNHRRVVSIIPFSAGVEIRSKIGGGQYYFGGDAAIGVAIYEAAVGKANQTLVEQLDGAPTRHIPRDVRQRVWQRYGGRCADCGATQYLEFDHIVPVNQGGSNSDLNIQLLCRGCNLRKSDHI